MPASIAPLQVPVTIKPKLKAELERLTDIGVLIPVDEPTDWVSNLVIATKESGHLRLCLDKQQLNKALKREKYPLPVIDDARNDQLSCLTTFDMHSVASEIFQMRLNRALDLLDGLLTVHDDMQYGHVWRRRERRGGNH